MRDERVKLIIKNMELLLEQLKLEFEDEESKKENKNIIHINDIITKDDYEEPEYYEESDDFLPNVSLRWRNKNDL
jgi:hypothetical protein